MNFSAIWKTVKGIDSGVSHLKKEYDEIKKRKEELTIDGKRSLFFQAIEFRIPFVNFNEVKKPIVQSVDGIHVIDRISCEVYRETTEDIFLDPSNVRIRESLIKTPQGFSSPRIWLSLAPVNYTGAVVAAFDFEWRLETGSSERSYCVDAFDGLSFMSSDTLCPGVDGELELFRPFALKGNESFTFTIKPTLFPILSQLGTANPKIKNDDVYIVSVYTIGHKVIGATS